MEYDFYVYLTALSRIFATECAAGRRLWEEAGSLEKLFSFSEAELSDLMPGGRKQRGMILDPKILDWAYGEVEWAHSHGIRMSGICENSYPLRLKECPDAPLMLYCAGNAELNPVHVLSVVGTRKSGWYGEESCRKIVSGMAEADTVPQIVSGLALGIDGTAHRTALDCGMSTVAVLPCGLNSIYPACHRNLAAEILKNGALVTDFFRDSEIRNCNFIRRNRIIAGMADAVVVCESFRKGGSLITASLASSYGREILAVPGHMGETSFEGCNQLIESDMAKIVISPESILKHLCWQRNTAPERKTRDLFSEVEDPVCSRILAVLARKSPVSAEYILRNTGLSAEEISVALLKLEMESLVASVEGGKYTVTL